MLTHLPVTEEFRVLGLSKLPTFKDENLNALDWVQPYAEAIAAITGWGIPDGSGSPGMEFSSCNVSCLHDALVSKENCRFILEIGMEKSGNVNSSTKVFLDYKKPETIYVGIDLNDNSKFHNGKDAFALQMNSLDHFKLEEFMKEHNIDAFDIIFIDGDHSINMVLSDWKYTKYLSHDGIVGMHDINFHPGPRNVFDCVDEVYYDKKDSCGQTSDFGIGILRKKPCTA
jgi:hypothetical protein